jgi:NADH-quinone oxidoreductase subunit E
MATEDELARAYLRPGWGAPTSEDARPVARFAHGSRVPGWDDAVDPEKDPAGVPDPATTFVPAELRTEIEGHMAKYPDRRSAALPALAAAQRLHGWCSPTAIEQVATVMRLTPAYLNAVATFYDMLDTRPVGRHRLYVCTNISCSLRGADALYERLEAQTAGDEDFELRHFECLGACDMAPMASIDGVYVGPIELDEVPEMLDQVRAGEPPLPRKQLALRRSTDPDANTREFPDPAEDQAHVAVAQGSGLPVRPPEQDTFGQPSSADVGGEQVRPADQMPSTQFDEGFNQGSEQSP